jgi:hypothetical protein
LIAGVAPASMLHRGICDAYHQGLAHVSGKEGVQVLGRSQSPPSRIRHTARRWWR